MPAASNATNYSTVNDRLYGQGLKLRLRCHGGKLPDSLSRATPETDAKKPDGDRDTVRIMKRPSAFLSCLIFGSKTIPKYARNIDWTVAGLLDHIPNTGWFVEIEGPLRKISQTPLPRTAGGRPRAAILQKTY